MRDFFKELNDLYEERIESFELDPEEFEQFYEAWEKFTYRTAINGEAMNLGKIIYKKVK